MTNQEYADGLRGLADFYASRPDFPQPHNEFMICSLDGREGLGSFIRMAARPCNKETSDGRFYVETWFGKLRLYAFSDNVCKKIVKGVKTVIEKVPVAFEEREVEKEIVEWECPESLLASEGEK